LVFVLLVSIGMSWLGVKMERARRQREAVKAIEKLGGSVGYERDGWPSLQNSARRLFGDDFFSDVLVVTVCGEGFGDDEMNYLKRLTKLEMLGFYHAQITDAGLEHVAGLTTLTELTLEGTEITDAGVTHLERLTGLAILELSGTQVTPEGVKKLREALPECEIVYDE
jgi:hypothetical protein